LGFYIYSKMKQLLTLLAQIETFIPDYEKTNAAVSQASVGWQIDHSLLVVNGVINVLKKSNPEDYKWKLNKSRLLLQITNKIPRGRAKSPQSVIPLEITTKEVLLVKMELAKKQVVELEKLPTNSYFTHPYFGDLNLKSTLWFLKLHTKHHLKIMEDILKTKNPEI
jgi:hypothetical protein